MSLSKNTSSIGGTRPFAGNERRTLLTRGTVAAAFLCADLGHADAQTASFPSSTTQPSMSSDTAIRNLIADYSWKVDFGDLEGFAKLFLNGFLLAASSVEPSEDQVRTEYAAAKKLVDEHHQKFGPAPLLVIGGELRAKGVKAFADFFREHGFGKPDYRGRHAVTNTFLEVDEVKGLAEARSYLLPRGRYFDKFERVQGAWRFSSRVYCADLDDNHAGTQPK